MSSKLRRNIKEVKCLNAQVQRHLPNSNNNIPASHKLLKKPIVPKPLAKDLNKISVSAGDATIEPSGPPTAVPLSCPAHVPTPAVDNKQPQPPEIAVKDIPLPAAPPKEH
uniref:Uncharacterized protein n=1 Tax=Meloidogyne javanica TaxID=6303 RepID=A0A915MYQ8_MELJA